MSPTHPPGHLSAFNALDVAQPSNREDVATEFALRCSGCGGDRFHVTAAIRIAPDPSPYFGVQAGRPFPLPPHAACCSHCGVRGTLFDARLHGWDGALNGGCSYECGATEEMQELEGDYELTVEFSYRAAPEVREAAAQGSGVDAENLFDWISIRARRTTDGQTLALEYECA